MNDRMIDDSVSKAQYMKILVNTIKDDLTKISGMWSFLICWIRYEIIMRADQELESAYTSISLSLSFPSSSKGYF